MRVRIVYGPRINFYLPGGRWIHPFDGQKFARAMALLEHEFGQTLAPLTIEAKDEAGEKLLLTAHTPAYLSSLAKAQVIARIIERPLLRWLPAETLNRRILAPMRYGVAGTNLALRLVLERKADAIYHFGGGFHHAFPDRGEGFCAYNDVAVAIASARSDGQLATGEQIAIVDLDAHRGNGNAAFFANDPAVRTMDFFNCFAYPGLPEGNWEEDAFSEPWKGTAATDEVYLNRLKEILPKFLDRGEPKAVIYIAGTDVIKGDKIGGLALTPQGVLARDLCVVDEARIRKIPIVLLTGGGYTQKSHQLIAATAAELLRLNGS